MLFLAFFISLLFTLTTAADSYTTYGCLCIGACERTIDSPFIPWCITSRTFNSTTGPCGSVYSTSRAAYWQPCTVNVTGESTGGSSTIVFPLTTFSSMFIYIASPAALGVAAAYGLVGLAAALRGSTTPLKTALWLPAAAAAIGGLHGIAVGAPVAALLSLLYLSLPYAIDASVAVALGLSVAALVVFAALSRDGLGGVDE